MGGQGRDSRGGAGAGRPQNPKAFGAYRLAGRIARGGMAEVFYALPTEQEPETVLAIKCMRPSLAKEERFIDMFVREGRLAMLLDHPNIVRTVDVGEVDGRSYIAMHFVPGMDLNQILKRCADAGRRVPVPHAIFIAAAVSRALHYAHELSGPQGRSLDIVNRDVSPANVRITFDGEVKLLDFGIAQAVMKVQSEIGILKGKFAYMSPEQIRGLPLDRRTDVFSTGIVLHELLTCERLFRDDSEFALMEKVRRSQIKPPSATNKRVPADLDAVVMRALERDKSKRFQTSLELAEALDPLLERYEFVHSELGDFTRSLFPSTYRKTQDLLTRLISPEDAIESAALDDTFQLSALSADEGLGAPGELGGASSDELEAADESELVIGQLGARRGKRRESGGVAAVERDQQDARPAPKRKLLGVYVAAVTLLAAAAALLVIALR